MFLSMYACMYVAIYIYILHMYMYLVEIIKPFNMYKNPLLISLMTKIGSDRSEKYFIWVHITWAIERCYH